MKIYKTFLILFILCFTSTACKTDSERKLVNKKAALQNAMTLTDTPMILETSVYAQILKKEELRAFKDIISESLKGLLMGTAGPYTVFTPTNETLNDFEENLKDETFAKGHIVKGTISSVFLVQKIRENRGVFKMITIGGNELKASRNEMEIIIEDEQNRLFRLELSDLLAENGVVHTIAKLEAK